MALAPRPEPRQTEITGCLRHIQLRPPVRRCRCSADGWCGLLGYVTVPSEGVDGLLGGCVGEPCQSGHPQRFDVDAVADLGAHGQPYPDARRAAGLLGLLSRESRRVGLSLLFGVY
jgi:hypothetical protein